MKLTSALSLLLTILLVGCDSKPTPSPNSASPSDRASTSDKKETKLVSVRVTGMMCPHSCLKDVEAILTKTNDVESIELTPQKDPDKIDNPVVLVRYRGQLNKDATSQAIVAAGFEKVEFEEK